MTHKTDCAHCAVNAAIDKFSEAHSPMNIDVIIDDLAACMCELIAMYDDPKVRKFVAKRASRLILERANAFRAQGRYPGGPGQEELRMLHEMRAPSQGKH